MYDLAPLFISLTSFPAPLPLGTLAPVMLLPLLFHEQTGHTPILGLCLEYRLPHLIQVFDQRSSPE